MARGGSFRSVSHTTGLVTLIGRLLQSEVASRLDDHDLTFAQAVLLVRLWRSEHGSAPQSQLIDSLALSRATGSQLLANLERSDLIAREVSSDDARKQIVHLTKRGKALETPVLAVFGEVEAILVRSIGANEQRVTHATLRGMLTNLRRRDEDG